VYIFYGLWLVVLGALAAPSLVIARRPEAKDLIAKIAPYQGWIGAVSALGGAWGIIQSILNLGWLSHWPVWWATYAASEFLQFALGLLLGVNVLKSFIKNAQANEKMDQTIAKLAPFQGRLGVGAIGLGIWMIVASFVFFH
jgi:hypothetical protein